VVADEVERARGEPGGVHLQQELRIPDAFRDVANLKPGTCIVIISKSHNVLSYVDMNTIRYYPDREKGDQEHTASIHRLGLCWWGCAAGRVAIEAA
jgi:hypothetical protein